MVLLDQGLGENMKKNYVIMTVVVVTIATMLTATVAVFAKSNEVPSSKNTGVPVSWISFGKRMLKSMMGYCCRVRGFEVIVSDEFKQKVIGILQQDPDTASLLEQGYNVTEVKPIITMIVGGDGSITLKATKAIAILCKNSAGRVLVYIDVDVGKVLAIYKFEAIVKGATETAASAKLTLRC